MKNALIAGAVALAVTGLAYFYAPKVAPEQNFGAVSSPDINSPYISFGGVRLWALRSTARAATTTVCAIQSPAGTSTLTGASVGFSVSSTTASTITIAKAATAFATTTVLEREPVAAGKQVSIMVPANYSTLATSTLLFAPNQWVVVGMEGGTGTFSPTGSCQASFTQVSY